MRLRPGETVVVYPHHVVTLDALDAQNQLVYGVFEGAGVASYFDDLGFYDCATGRTDAHYESIMALSRQLDAPRKRTEAQMRKCYVLLTDILRTQAIEMRRNGDALVFDAVRMVHRNLRRRKANVKALCDGLGLNRMQLNRLFAKAGLGTPSGFIRGEQLHYVRDLLENTDLPLVEVAARAGFLSSAHFTTFVKRKTHQTPLQIRQGKTS